MKILVVRFSSIGDVLQTLSVLSEMRRAFPQAEIHMATQSRFTPFFNEHPIVRRVWTVDQKTGLKDLWKLSGKVSQEKFTHIYDAHNNLRSRLLTLMLRFRGQRFHSLRRPIYRWRRFLLFKLRINLFPQPFSGQMDQLRPLKRWGVDVEIPKEQSLFLSENLIEEMKALLEAKGFKSFIAMAPSAAYPLKRWPRESFEQLVSESSEKFVLLGGPEDQFLAEMALMHPDRVLNLAGRLSLMESAAVVFLSEALVSNDTGVMHMAEQLNHPCVALMGPAPFGYPSKPSTLVLERELWCRPCSKHGQGPCVNKEFQKCLKDISVGEVASAIGKVRCLI